MQTINPLHFTDQNNNTLTLGDVVKVTKGKHKGNADYVFVFCIPQHRFGFIHKMIFDEKVANNNKAPAHWFEKRLRQADELTSF